VALARALAADPPILLIDGADEALDAKTARELGATLRTLARERTVLVVARGRPLLEYCDRIYVLERGRIVEEVVDHGGEAVDAVAAAGMRRAESSPAA
jgi:ABC-type bacteriocin/lantibiotic exporter with double-glycine peptidase domain